MPRFRLVPVLVLVVAGSALACGGNTDQRKHDFVTSGDAFLEQGQFREAIVEYRNAVELDDRFAEARRKLARAYLAVQAPMEALNEYVRVADLLPGDLQAQIDAGRMLLRAGQFEDARSRAERALVIDGSSVDGHLLRAAAAAGMRDYEIAIETVEEAIELDPRRSGAYLTLATVRSATGAPSAAEAAFRRAIEVAPDSVTARLALANYLWRARRIAEAEQPILEALEIEPDNLEANRALAFLRIATGRSAEAETPLRAMAERSASAEPWLALADYYISEGRTNDARTILTELSDRREAFAASRVRLAGVAYLDGNQSDAYAMVEEVLAKEPNNPQVLLVKGGWLLAEGRADQALAVAEKLLNVAPHQANSHVLLAKVKIAGNDLAGGIESYTEALRQDPGTLEAQIGLAELHARSGDGEAAVKFGEEAVQNQPGNLAAHLALARALVTRGSLSRAEDEVKLVATSVPDIVAVHVLTGQIQMQRGNTAAARQSFARALEIEPGDMEALDGLVAADLAAGQTAAALDRIDTSLRSSPEGPALLVLAGRTHAIARNFARAEELLRRALEIDPGFMQAYHILGQALVAQDRLDEARTEYEAMASRRPNDVAVQTMVAMILQVQNDWDGAEAQYNKILGLDPRAPVAANNLAYMHAERGTNLNVALSLAQTAKEVLPNEPDVDDTLGWVYYKQGLATLAVPPLERAARADSSNPLYQFHLGMAYLEAKDLPRAKTALEAALKLSPSFEGAAEARKALASIQN